ncbi:hypothetical protein Acor_05990 [Acrocarpospora corrugata]|uniref:Uncharacterized protein n=1 Tax=Acrocarpospora corrugata TaxID=35763 RepID=A0A5M3VVW7_9ACTN|nr:hypothetical protein [Acrocarpospora corrugata]GER98537.1 hypothetical protein Acor_05990 [Acrocarpospora corrugata]
MFRVLYLGWLVAFVFKVLGASWDVSWHFRWIRDDLAPPHMLNTIGTALAVALTIVHWYTGYGVDRTASRLIQWGTGLFLIAVPLDLINHRVNGLDITAWSPSHALLFIGTAFMIAGVIRGWFVGAPAGRTRTVVLTALFGFFLENAIFPSQHQEYGVLGLAAWVRGQPEAEPELLKFAAESLGRPIDLVAIQNFSLPVPDSVYSVYAGVVGMIILIMARIMVGRAGTATAIAVGYLAYRTLIWPLLVVGGFPGSAIPYFLLVAAVAVDLAFLIPLPTYIRPLLGTALITAGVYGGLYLQDLLLEAPPYGPGSWPLAAGLLFASWLVVELLSSRFQLRAPDAAPAEVH